MFVFCLFLAPSHTLRVLRECLSQNADARIAHPRILLVVQTGQAANTNSLPPAHMLDNYHRPAHCRQHQPFESLRALDARQKRFQRAVIQRAIGEIKLLNVLGMCFESLLSKTNVLLEEKL